MTRLRLFDVALDFRRPLGTADGTYTSRRSVIVGHDHDGITGWGEAAAFPSGRWGTIDQVWEALAGGDAQTIAAMPLARAALQAAQRDHRARAEGVPLCRSLGGTLRPVAARLTVGLARDPNDLVDRVAALATTGARAVKLKIRPGADLDHISAVRAAFPDLAISVDANGGYTDPDDPVFPALDRLGIDLIEQPLPPGDLAGSARLRRLVAAAVCLDEDIRSTSDAARILDAGAADVLSLKSMRLGYDTSLEILDRCREAGIVVKAGGTFDAAIGRHHVLAFATLEGVTDAEAGPPTGYLVDSLAEYPAFEAGGITPIEAPGIGIDPDPQRLLAASVRSLVVENSP